MTRLWAAFAAFMLLAMTGGCAAVQPPDRVAVDLNRAFAQSRDEVLLLNVLRASGRQPLQFSTMGTVTGSGRGAGSVSLPLANLIGGGTNPFTVSPTLSASEGNPSLSIIPLSHREFTEGILRPITPEILSYFVSQGWGSDFILPLAVGGVRCPGGSVVPNSGDYTEDLYYRFADMFSPESDEQFALEQRRLDSGPPIRLRMASKDALPFLQNGVGPGRRVVGVSGEGESAIVEIRESRSYWVASGLDLTKVCTSATQVAPQLDSHGRSFTLLQDVPSDDPLRGLAASNGALQLRSVESIIYFLGETQRIWFDRELARCAGRDLPAGEHPDFPTYRSAGDGTAGRVLFRVRVACGGVPPLRAAVRTSFSGRNFYIPPLSGRFDDDRTLKTLSFLSELIALQTNQSLIEASSPTIAVQR